jgi:hypothetical protein
MVESPVPEASVRPSGEKATDKTKSGWPAWPISVRGGAASAGFGPMVRVALPEAVRPAGFLTLLTPDRALILTFRDSQADSGEWPLPVDLGHRVAQGFVGDSHEAAVGLAQLKDKENRARDRERAH